MRIEMPELAEHYCLNVGRQEIDMKRTVLIIGGIFWLLFALGFGFFLIEYIVQGSGLQFFGHFISPTSVFMGLAHVVGLCVAIGLCFAIGAGLCAHGLVPRPAIAKEKAMRPKPMLPSSQQVIVAPLQSIANDSTQHCVCCKMPLEAGFHICPKCCWTQPHYNTVRGIQ